MSDLFVKFDDLCPVYINEKELSLIIYALNLIPIYSSLYYLDPLNKKINENLIRKFEDFKSDKKR